MAIFPIPFRFFPLLIIAAMAPLEAYTGAYCDFDEGEDHVTLEALEKFQELTGKPLAIVAFGSFWARGKFPVEQVNLVRAYGAVPLLFWSPWDAPFDQKRGPDRFSLTEILAGKWDAYIDSWADEAAKVPSQFFVSFACEMNGTWFPWSGWFYGKGPRDPAPVMSSTGCVPAARRMCSGSSSPTTIPTPRGTFPGTNRPPTIRAQTT